MADNAQAEINVKVTADNSQANAKLAETGRNARAMGAQGAAGAGAFAKGLGGVSAAAQAAQGGILNAASAAKGLAAALGSVTGGIVLAGLAAAVGYFIRMRNEARAAREEAEKLWRAAPGKDLEVGNWHRGVREDKDSTLAHGNEARATLQQEFLGREAALAQARLQAERERALGAAGGDANAAARVNADYDLKAAELAARVAKETSKANVDALQRRLEDLDRQIASRTEERDETWAASSKAAERNSDDAEDLTRKALALDQEVNRLAVDRAALEKWLGWERDYSPALADASLAAAGQRHANALAGIARAEEESGAGRDAARSSSPLSVASDAMRRIGAEAGGAAPAVPQKLDLLTRILEQSREYMRRVAEQTKSPIATFA